MVIHQLELEVFNAQGEPVEGVAVYVEPEAAGVNSRAEFDAQRQVYFFDHLSTGFYRVSLEHSDFESQSARLQVHPKPTSVPFTLRPLGAPYAFRGVTRVPYESKPELLGVIPAADAAADAANDSGGQTLDGLLDSLGLVREETGQPDADSGADNVPGKRAVPDAFIVRRTQQDSDDSGNSNEDLRALRESPLVEAAGPLFQQEGDGFSFFTNRLTVRFRPEWTLEQVLTTLEREHLRMARELKFAPNTFLVEADPSIGEGINQVAENLVKTGGVEYAEPNLAQAPELDQITPNDYLWPGVWDRQHVRAGDAWQRLHDEHGAAGQFGSPEIIVAVVDQGIKSVGGAAEHPDFQGNVSNGSSKVYKLFNFRLMKADNDEAIGAHGVSCAGVTAGVANDVPAGGTVGFGVAGAAPNVRLMGLIFPATEDRVLEMYLWAAGLDARSNLGNFPQRIAPGADIFTCSIGFGSGSPLSGAARDMFDHITRRGRGGKGCLALFSAGNNNLNIENFRPFGSYERSFSVAASTLDVSRNEIRAPYSGWGKVAWCAPSHSRYLPSGFPAPHNPPNDYGVWTATFLNEGNLPSFPVATTALSDDANPGDTRIKVNSITGLAPGLHLLIGDPGIDGAEPVSIVGAPNPATRLVPISPLMNAHHVGDTVVAGQGHHVNNFGGTSSATPLSAGICALVLSANPRLTWVEAREILRETAVKFDTNNNDPVGRWLDRNGVPSTTNPFFSRWYGYGRLNADAAVKKALEYDFPRDLVIRKDLSDTGVTPSAPSSDSPDIWVRNADPAHDPGALPADYSKAGPHRNPNPAGGRWVYARVKNRGSQPTYDAWVRFYVASATANPFVFPEDWEAQNGVNNHTPTTWNRGTYFIGEVALPAVAPGADFTVNIPWPDGLMPPALAPNGGLWNPHILVEITPQDGPLIGALIHENNNLAQKAVSVVDDDTADVEVSEHSGAGSIL